MRSIPTLAVVTVLAALAACGPSSSSHASSSLKSSAGAAAGERPARLPGLHDAASIVRDRAGIAHVKAGNEHDLFFLQGWMHAQDRLFQMDVTRRRASGTLAELLGPGALSSDVQMRTFGLRRAAEATLPILSARARAAVEAYAEGVNAWVDGHALPPEYAALELTEFEPWTAVDSVAVGKIIAFGLSFDVDDIQRTVALQTYAAALGPERGAALFFQDVFRSAPFDRASTVPDASQPGPATAGPRRASAAAAPSVDPRTIELGARVLQAFRDDPYLRRLLHRDARDGSNQWVVAGKYTESGSPMLASDPHLALGAPSTFYPIHLTAGPFDVIGNSFAGAPFVMVGHNRHAAWGATVDPFDVTDVYQEKIVADPTSPSGLSTVYLEKLEHVLPIPESYRVNLLDGVMDDLVAAPDSPQLPKYTLVVPRRTGGYGGPIIQLDMSGGEGVALSVAYPGFGPTREVETFLGFDAARNMREFVEALRTFDTGSQNFCYADDAGNIAYFTNSAIPIREDLQRNTVDGLPPAFIRDGTGGNEWLPVEHPQPGQIVPFEVLPLEELPHIVNPPAGFAVNANNDPAGVTLANDVLANQRPGGGIYYIAPGFDGGFRAGRITTRIHAVLDAGEKMSFREMQSIQADVKLRDAEVLVPYVVRALENARREGAPDELGALAADAAVADAVRRLAAWDASTPTGIPEGYDASDVNGVRGDPAPGEVDASVAATIYSVWRGQIIHDVVDAHLGAMPKPPGDQALSALRNLLDTFEVGHGVGASGIDFFSVPGVTASAEDRRDLLLLNAVSGALARLSSDAFQSAFGGSTNPEDWRWGKLHRIVFSHPLGGPFSIPPAFGEFPALLSPLRGISTDGGYGVPDASSHDARAGGPGDGPAADSSTNRFMFGSGPSNRLVVELSRGAVKHAESTWPGGPSAVPTSPYYVNLLPLWLTNDTVPLWFRESELVKDAASLERFVP